MKKGTRLVAIAAAAGLAAATFGMGTAAQAATTTVTIYGGYAAGDADAFQSELDLAFPASSGIKVQYTSLASFDTDITTKIKAGQEPDIALWPQPGGLLKQKSALVPLDQVLGADFAPIVKTFVPGFESLGKDGGKTYGLPVSANLKSIVFYNPAIFKANHWTVPTTDGALASLEKKIAASGKAYPWCAGTESGGATGWSLTDWMEELVLKNAGVDVYNKWWSGAIHWNDPRIVAAGKALEARLLAKGQVQGGGPGITARNFGLATTAGLFETSKTKGACAMLKQGSFITGMFPDKIKAEIAKDVYTHVGVFAYPKGKAGGAVLGGGDTAGVFHNTAAVAKVAAYIMSDKLGTKGYATNASGFLSPHKTFQVKYMTNPLNKLFQTIYTKASGFGFDGSDQAPPAVNKAEWNELTNWFAGKETMAKAFSIIDAAYNN